MRSCRTILFRALMIGSVSSWAPNSHFSVKPQKTRTQPQTEFHPVQWAAAGIMAASLAFSPLPSNAADVPPADVVQVSVPSLAPGSSAESMIYANTRIPVMMLEEPYVEKVSEVLAAASTLVASNEEQQPLVLEKTVAPMSVVEETKAIESLASTTTLVANSEVPKPVETKKEEPKSVASTTTLVANSDGASKPAETKKEEPKKDAKKAPEAKKKDAPKAAKKASPKKDSKKSNEALVAGLGAGAALLAAGIGSSNRRTDTGYIDPRYTLRSNAPYSSEVYESGSYGGAVPYSTQRPRRMYPQRRRQVTAGSRVPYPNSMTYYNVTPRPANLADSNIPYAQDVYASGSYGRGVPNVSRTTRRPFYSKRNHVMGRMRSNSNRNYYVERNTNSADSNAPYSYDTYASGSYSSGFSVHNKSGRRRYNRNSSGQSRMIYSNPNAPYAEDTYASGSYGSYSNGYTRNNSVFRPKWERQNKARQWNDAVRRRKRASYNLERYGPDARKNGSVVNYLRPDVYDVNTDGYNPKEPW